MTLVVQTNVAGHLSVWVVRSGRIVGHRTRRVAWHGSDQALLVVDRVLTDVRQPVNKLRRIVVVRGPGSFTAVRTGLIIANTIGTLLRIPICGIVQDSTLTDEQVRKLAGRMPRGSRMVRPWYGKEPNITRPRVAGQIVKRRRN